MISITRKYSNMSLRNKVLCIIIPLVMVALALFGISFVSLASSRAGDNGKLNIIIVTTSPPTHDPTLTKIYKTSRPTTITESPIIIVTSPPTHDPKTSKPTTIIVPQDDNEEKPCLFFESRSQINIKYDEH
jgi:hypothetical protein